MSAKFAKTTAFIFLAFLGFCSADNGTKVLSDYNLGRPDDYHILPDYLHEVSGLTYLGLNEFACIQDENGILFFYDAGRRKIVRQLTFGTDGDYEGIARVNNTIYVLRSDGVLFEISDYNSGKFSLDIFFTHIPSNNNEGLCFDRVNNRLLIACKGKTGKGSEFKDKREIYCFDLITKTLTKDPVFEFDLSDIKRFALESKTALPFEKKGKGKPKEPVVKLETSDICIHPVTKKLYVLSASDYLLFVFNMNGALENLELLDPELFGNAEGIAFFENGDMVITNEGQNKSATLLRFNYKIKK